MKTFEIYKDENGILNFDGNGEWAYTLRCSSDAYADQHLEHLQKAHDRMNKKKKRKTEE